MTGYSVLKLIKDEGLQANSVTYATLMQLCAKCAGRGRYTTYPTQRSHVVTLCNLSSLDSDFLDHCVHRASVQDGLQVLDRARASKVELNIWVYNSLMDLVAKSSRCVHEIRCGSKGRAAPNYMIPVSLSFFFVVNFFIFVPDINHLSSPIHSLAISLGQADSLDGLAVLKRLRDEGLKPDTTTYNSLLEVYVHCASKGSKTLNDGLQVIFYVSDVFELNLPYT